MKFIQVGNFTAVRSKSAHSSVAGRLNRLLSKTHSRRARLLRPARPNPPPAPSIRECQSMSMGLPRLPPHPRGYQNKTKQTPAVGESKQPVTLNSTRARARALLSLTLHPQTHPLTTHCSHAQHPTRVAVYFGLHQEV